jgi:hypothetical protein
MKTMGENSFDRGVRALLRAQAHEYFVELCALSTSGTLTTEEIEELQKHLLVCSECRETKRQYEELIAHTVPLLAPDAEAVSPGDVHRSWSSRAAEAALLSRLDRAEPVACPRPFSGQPSLSIYRWRGWPQWGAAAAILIAACAMGYLAGVRVAKRPHGELRAGVVDSRERDLPRQQMVPALQTQSPSMAEKEAAELKTQLRFARQELATLREQRATLELRLSEQRNEQDRGAEERAALDQKLAATEGNLQTLQARLDSSTHESLEESAQFVEQQTHINDLRASLREREQKLTQDEQLLEHDRDIRNLMGARDLYIAEIYDVAKTGDTQKPFGRVFYTKGKSLVFYAYDLEEQRGARPASTFQAWGRTGTDSKQDRNLGIFYQDEINKQRWILKSDDAKTLSQIDAVFVTIEPKGESARPSGKPLLFTYLRMTPNHP